MLEWPLFNTILGSSVAAATTFLAARYWYQKAAVKEMNARIADLERKQSFTDQVVQPVWAAIQSKLVETLTHTHEKTTDALLERLEQRKITDEEEAELIVALGHRETDPKAGPAERLAAKAMPIVMELAKIEAAAVEQPDVQIIVKPVAFVVPLAPKEEK